MPKGLDSAEFPAKHQGRKTGFRRPVLSVSSDAFNRSRIRTVIAVVLTANLRLVDAPGNVLVPGKASGLPKDSVANVSQVVTLDKEFLANAGRLKGQLLSDIESACASSSACSLSSQRLASVASVASPLHAGVRRYFDPADGEGARVGYDPREGVRPVMAVLPASANDTDVPTKDWIPCTG